MKIAACSAYSSIQISAKHQRAQQIKSASGKSD